MAHIALPAEMTRPAVRQVFAALEAAGGEGCVRFVGGCVRDVVMGRMPGDLDLSTRLTPDETEAALLAAGLRHVPTGKAFGTITAIVESTPFEITSLREDVETDGRRAVVSYTMDWAIDAQRRDFYLNALYADIRGEVFDPTGHGLEDARRGRVRFIGSAETRIREDYLRILRFFRFSASHAAVVDDDSLSACVALKEGIDTLSGERLQQELFKLFTVPDPSAMVRRMIDTGVMVHILGGLHVSGMWFAAAMTLTEDPEQRLAALIAPEGLSVLNAVSAHLRLSNRHADRLKLMAAAFREARMKADEAALRRWLYRYGRQPLADALLLRAAADGVTRTEWMRLDARLHAMDVPVFPLRSSRLIEAGLRPGPELGQVLRRTEDEWVANDFSSNVIEAAIDAIRERANIRGV